jgi:tRNA G18 (ribose-2'-O)-methylase SpoU
VRLLVAEGLTNVDNMGALFRGAAAFGIDGILLDPACCDPLYRKAIRVSMGHVLAVPYAVGDSWPDDLARLKAEWGVTIIGAETDLRAVPVWDAPREPKTAILFGAEGEGITPQAMAHCDALVQIPMPPGVPSLNVAVAASICMYELYGRGERE